MKFGVFQLLHSADKGPAKEVYDNALEQAKLADELGFEGVWLAEHHFSSYGYNPNPLTFAVKIADHTKNLRIGTAVVVLPLYQPVRLAEEIALADQLTDGRLEVGLGRGYQRYEFERLGLNLDDSRSMFDEALEIIEMALTQENFNFEGNYYQVPETTIFPRPIQQPHPPFWIAAQSPASIVDTVQRGYNCITGGSSAPSGRVLQSWEVFRDAVNEAGLNWPQEFTIQAQVHVAENDEFARAQTQNALWHLRSAGALRANTQKVVNGLAIEQEQPNEPTPELMYNEWLLFGNAETVKFKLQRLLDTTGITYLNCVFAIGRLEHKEVLKSMERFARDVMPYFRDKVGLSGAVEVKS
jgi:alkanesulfonate monooxygenase SsuD/methylene tetrahydromethanopterin reductase-like flavin-dependent oxidoreductase (luciferase family)